MRKCLGAAIWATCWATASNLAGCGASAGGAAARGGTDSPGGAIATDSRSSEGGSTSAGATGAGGSAGSSGTPRRTVPPGQTVDLNATDETRALFANLQARTQIASSGVLFGMQDALDRGFFSINPNGTINWSAGDGVKSDIRTITGKGPAMVGFDASGIVGDWWDPTRADFESLKNSTKTNIRSRMRLQYDRGGISEMTWHMANPMSGKPDSYREDPRELWRIAPPAACTQLTSQGHSVANCGSHFSVFQAKLLELADWMLTVTDSGGHPIPIVFRPFHENSGGWFWWGSGGGAADARYRACFQAIWSWMVDYMTNTKGVHQLLWAISPNGHGGWAPYTRTDYLSFMPSMDLVDVLGYDFYSQGMLSSATDTWEGGAVPELIMLVALARENHKIAAFTEGGWTNGYQSYVVSSGSGTVAVNANPQQCQPGGAIYQWWTRQQIGPVLEVGGLAWYHSWANSPNPDGSQVYGPVPGNCTGDDFRAAWQSHQVLLEGEGLDGLPFDYYSAP